MKGYKKQLFWYAVALEFLAIITFACACFAIVWAVAVENMTTTYKERLQALDNRAMGSMRIVQEYVSVTAEQENLVAACEELLHSEITNDQNLALQKIRRVLIQMLYYHGQIKHVFVVTPDAIITQRDYLPRPNKMKFVPMSDAEMTALAAGVLEQLEEEPEKTLQSRNVLYAAVNAETALVAIMSDSQIFAQDDTWAISVEDMDGNMIYQNGQHPQHFRTVEYINLQNSMRYVYRMDTRALSLRILHELRTPILLTVALSVPALYAIYWMTQWALHPYALIGRSLRDYESMKRKFPVLMQRLRSAVSIRTRVILLYSLGLLPMLCTLSIMTRYMEECVVQAMSEAHRDTVIENALSLSGRAEAARRFVSMITSDERLHDFLYEGKEQDAHELGSLLIRYHAFRSGVDEVGIYRKDGTAIYRTSARMASGLTQSQLNDFQPNYAFCRFYPDAFSNEQTAIIATVRNIEERRQQSLFSVLGYVCLRFDNLFSGVTGETEMGSYYLYDRENWHLTATSKHLEERLLVEGICQAELIDLEQGETRQVVLPDTHEKCLMFAAPVKDTQYTLICLLSTGPLQKFAERLPGYIVVFFCGFALLILCVAALFAWRITRFSKIVEDYCASASADLHNLPTALSRENEISALGWAFFESMERISQLNDSLLQEQKKQTLLENRRRQAEVIALQSQMDSHLIGNIFAAMKLLLAQGPSEYGTLKRLVEATGDFLRSGLVHDEYDVTLAREIEHVNAYVTIQVIRFGDRLQIHFEPVETALLEVWVPKYLLQPLIENSIIHGMRPRSTLHVSIAILRKGDDLCVCVEDDGTGMEEEALQRLRIRLCEGAVSERIGLINVAERIRLRYGKEHSLCVESRPGGPTRITILLPLTQKLKGEEEHVQADYR